MEFHVLTFGFGYRMQTLAQILVRLKLPTAAARHLEHNSLRRSFALPATHTVARQERRGRIGTALDYHASLASGGGPESTEEASENVEEDGGLVQECRQAVKAVREGRLSSDERDRLVDKYEVRCSEAIFSRSCQNIFIWCIESNFQTCQNLGLNPKPRRLSWTE